MSNKRITELQQLQQSIKQFKKQHPKVDDAIKLYNANTEAKNRAQATRYYKTTTSTSPNGFFTTR